MIINEPLQNFLDKLASNAPTPGGGSVAALTGSLGAGLVTMVTCLTTGKEKYKAVQPQIDELLKKAEKARSELQALIQKDIDVFGSLSLVYAMPKITEAEKAARTTKMQEVLKAACQVPFEIGEKALEVAKLAKTAAEIGNAAAVSDAGVAVLLANCCAQSAEREFYKALAAEEKEHELILVDYYEYLTNPVDWFTRMEHHSLDGG